ncbi:MAG: NAD-dependent epimerase/dehydratase family protein [Candidatus Eisenbacteria bacterium]|nr:NAD-dependent epimerase/dehydratase family protein [Candidatus Eisenbacteria bacterium]MCC7140496.1 NAD-dependent epimerase/dehydratase family protein [Candidatus Eisenbacteria bacterium]
MKRETLSPSAGSTQESLFGSSDLYLVTGASGFVGSHLVEHLVKRGYRLRLLVRPSSRLHWLDGVRKGNSVQLAAGDVTDKGSCAGACSGVRGVFHVGGLIRAGSSREYQAANAQGTRNLAEALAERGLRGGFFVYCSSLAAGGPGFAVEHDPNPVRSESDPSTPISPYGQSKLDGEMALREVADAHGTFRHVVLRPPAVYGPRDAGILPLWKLLRQGIMPVPGKPGARLSMVFIDDLVSALVRVAEGGVRGTYYVDDGEVHTWEKIGLLAGQIMSVDPRMVKVPGWLGMSLALGAEFWGALSRQAPLLSREKLRELRQDHWVCSSEKARGAWGYTPRVRIEEGLRETLEWYRANQWL